MLLRPALDGHPRLVFPGKGSAVLPLEAGGVRAARGLVLGGDEGLGGEKKDSLKRLFPLLKRIENSPGPPSWAWSASTPPLSYVETKEKRKKFELAFFWPFHS